MPARKEEKVPIEERQDRRLEASRQYLQGEITQAKFQELERQYEGKYNLFENGAHTKSKSSR